MRVSGFAVLAHGVGFVLVTIAVGGLPLSAAHGAYAMAVAISLLLTWHRSSAHAFEDHLTGLANRALLTDRLEEALKRHRRSGSELALLVLDIDHFKAINDRYGQAVGDQVLREVAERVRHNLRSYDTAARLSGDGFAIVLEGVGEATATEAAARVQRAVSAPIEVGDLTLRVTASIGLAPTWGEADAEELIRRADLAMYLAKAHGRDRVEVFRPALETDAIDRLELEEDLHHALERDELVLYYQPMVSIGDGAVTGFEALIRWQHPKRGLVPPLSFIPLAEETGLILPIGSWVLEQACSHVADLQRRYPDMDRLDIHVNVSALQLSTPGFADVVAGVLVRSGLDPRDLILEITESVLVRTSDRLVETMQSIRAMGVRMAIDDFGTGYSSLSYLRQFPVDMLKIDRAFVQGVESGDGAYALTQAIVRLSESLGLDVVAEGIEEAAQVTALLTMGCSAGQGFLFAKPLDERAVEDLLAQLTAPLS